MDMEQEELQFLGFFGICKQSLKLISTWSKIFTKITLSLILPFSLIFLSHIVLSLLLSSKILAQEHTLNHTRQGTVSYHKISDLISQEWVTYWLIKAAYFICLLVFSLLSTSAVVYTVACAYSGKDITYKKVMSVVPKVWKRLIVTFLWSFAILFCYNVLFVICFIIWALFYGGGEVGNVVLVFMVVVFLVGFVYISIIWQLATVVSVLEDTYGIKAMTKSKNLIKGKTWAAVRVFMVINMCFVPIQLWFQAVMLGNLKVGVGGKVVWGLVSLGLVSVLFLVGLVAQTVVYFVCKSYHHESIDKSSLADHLEVYLGDYIPLNAKNLQLEEYHV